MASVFRDRISRGFWAPGQQLPAVPELCEEYGVGRITVRQALALLASDGLITSTRGRGTFVTAAAGAVTPNAAIRRAINDTFDLQSGVTIEILARTRVAALPADLATDPAVNGKTPAEYVHIRKIHRYMNRPFVLFDVYVLAAVYERFPRGAEKRAKIIRLMREHINIASSRQELTVGFAEPDVAAVLQYTMGGVVARIRRWQTDDRGRIVYAAIKQFRGDTFVLEIEDNQRPRLPPLRR